MLRVNEQAIPRFKEPDNFDETNAVYTDCVDCGVEVEMTQEGFVQCERCGHVDAFRRAWAIRHKPKRHHARWRWKPEMLRRYKRNMRSILREIVAEMRT